MHRLTAKRLNLATVALILTACTTPPATATPTTVATSTAASSDLSIVGQWECARGSDDPDILDFRADGTVTITHPDGVVEGPGTWSLEGTEGLMNPGEEFEEAFTAEGDRLVFGDQTECSPL